MRPALALGLGTLLAFSLVIALAHAAPDAPRAAFTVNSPADVPDANPGNGVCDTGGGACTLRAAIQEANALPGADVINLGAITVTLTRAGPTDDTALFGDLDISGTLSIVGASTATSFVDGNGAALNDRVFHILPGAQVTLRNLYVLNGKADNAALPYGGGALVEASGALTLSVVWMAKCTAEAGGVIFSYGRLFMDLALIGEGVAQHGGSIYSAGPTSANQLYVFYSAAQFGSGIFASGGPVNLVNAHIYNNFGSSSDSAGTIYNGTALTLTNSFVEFNGNGLGGGIFNAQTGALAMNNTRLGGNNAITNGGGIINFGLVRGVGVTLDDNTAGLRGAGIYNGGAGGGTLQLTNSTLSGNHANEAGGGIYQFSGSTALYNVTVASNAADYDNDDASDGGGIKQFGGTVTFRNSLLANNFHRRPIVFPPNVADDCKGIFTSDGYNLVEDTTDCTIGGTPAGNIFGQDPLLVALADNGGPTWTHALKPGSPARDGGNPSGCTGPLGAILITDQRGKLRSSDGDGDGVKRCDIGAFEAQNELMLPLIRR